jgi:PAS domain S-box-containing protein
MPDRLKNARPTLLRYGVAVTSVAAATLVTWLVVPINSRTPFALLYAAVMVSTLYGRTGPGLLAVALSALAGAYLFVPPAYSLAIGAEGLLQVCLFALVAMLIGLLTENRRRAAEALAESEARFQSLVELSPDAIVVHSGGKIVFINTPGARLLRASSAEQVVGRPVLELVHPDYHGIVSERLRRLAGGEVAPAMEMKFLRLDGTEICGELTSVPFTYRGRPAVQAVVRDVTERKRAEQALRAANERALTEYEHLLDRVTGLAHTLGTARDLVAVFRALKDFAIASVPGSGIFISLYDPASRTRSPVYAWSEGEEVDVSALPPMPMSDSPHSRAVSTGEVVITDDFQAAMAGKPVFNVGLERDPRLPRSCLAVPMSVMGRVVGAFEVQSTEPAAYGQQHATAMLMAASLAAVAVENVQLLERERRARAAAEESNRLKDEFLATISHELRTPLTPIIGWVAMLRAGLLGEAERARALEIIERSAHAQNRIINDLLDASRIIAGKLRLNVTPFDPGPIIEAAIETVRPAAEAKAIQIEAALAGACVITGDPERLQQVMWNLLSNAIKFTPSGGRIGVRLGGDDSHVEIGVSDTGVGIKPDFLPFVFDRFRQADSSSTRAYGGLGIGLSIVRQLVELHGGTVEAESPGGGQGATFTVRLPRTAVREAPPGEGRLPLPTQACAPPGPDPPLDGLRVFVIDDEADTLEMLTSILGQSGAEVRAATSTEEALRMLAQWRPDVLVSDIGMPGEDGYEMIRKLRALPEERGGHVPAVALTAYAGAEARRRALASGYQMHVPKPVEPSELVAVVASLAGRLNLAQ